MVLVEGRVANSLLKAAESRKKLATNRKTGRVRNVTNTYKKAHKDQKRKKNECGTKQKRNRNNNAAVL